MAECEEQPVARAQTLHCHLELLDRLSSLQLGVRKRCPVWHLLQDVRAEGELEEAPRDHRVAGGLRRPAVLPAIVVDAETADDYDEPGSELAAPVDVECTQ